MLAREDAGNVFALLLMLAASGVCWYFVFSQAARRRFAKRALIRPRDAEGVEFRAAVILAGAIVGGLVFGLAALAMLVMAGRELIARLA